MTDLDLRIYDSATAQVRAFKPLQPGHVGIYLCGATVQGSPHIGHVRSAIAFDVLIRWLERCGQQVTYIRNITDIDDKILRKSAEEGRPWWAHAEKYTREFAEAYRTLGVRPPTYEPRATGHILTQIELVQRLIERGHAYADGNGNVYFAVASQPDYGSLTHQKLENLATTEDESQLDAAVESGKRDPRDFALWKAWKPSEPETAAWDSPWGRGRPGWHLECSAMSCRYLGEAFDIHGGGIDLRFPHHENEQAQSHAAGWPFAQYWVHNAWVTIKGDKMSKSLGNSLTVQAITESVDPVVLRFALGTVNYRSTVEYSPEALELAGKNWARISDFVLNAFAEAAAKADTDPGMAIEFAGVVGSPTEVTAQQALNPGHATSAEISAELANVELPEAFITAMNNDLNVSGALAVVNGAVKAGNTYLREGDYAAALAQAWQVRAMMDVLGLDPLSPQWMSAKAATNSAEAGNGSAEALQALGVFVEQALAERAQARAEKNWAVADAVRDRLQEAGIVVEDGPDGARWHLR